MNKVRKRYSPSLFITLCAALAACSTGVAPDADAGTILFTNALGFDYVVLVHNRLDPTSTDTLIAVPNGTQVCWRMSGPRPLPITTELYSYYDPGGFPLAGTEVHPRLESWSWDGAGPQAIEASSC